MTDVCVVGHLVLDHVDSVVRAGGSAFYASHVYRDGGARVRLYTSYSDVDSECFDLEGVSLTLTQGRETTRFQNIYTPQGERAQRLLASASPLPAAAVDADVLHLAPVMGEVDVRDWLRVDGARLVGLGLQGWLRDCDAQGRISPKRFDVSRLRGRRDCVVFLSEEDLGGREAMLEDLWRACDLVYLTRGAAGVRVLRAGVEAADVPAPQVGHVVDPTGAGDAFAAATLLALARGDDALAAARRGVVAGAVCVAHAGTPPRGAYAP